MTDHAALEVGPAEAGMRLDAFLAQRMEGWSRSALARLIREGSVSVVSARTRVAPSSRVVAGWRVEVRLPAPRPSHLAGEDIPLSVLHEDEALLVIDKPAGLVVHPGAGVSSGTLVHALVARLGASLLGVGDARRPGLVHRLDKGTSGVLVVAKTPAAHASLVKQFASRQVRKLYRAVVFGVPPARGTMEAAIGRSRTVRTRMAVRHDGGRPARTEWTVEEAFRPHAALLSVDLKTGRTHQIRVHLSASGHPVVGDSVYGAGRASAVKDALARSVLQAFHRPALHAARLGLTHPLTGREAWFEAPEPEDFADLLRDLRSLASRPSRRSRS